MSLSPLQLNTEDVMRARPMLKTQPGLETVDPWEILDETGDPDLRKILVIWCVKSRTNPEFTWQQAMRTPFGEMYPDDEAEEEEPPPQKGGPRGSPGPASATPPASATKPRRPAAEPALNSSTSTG